MTGRMRKCGCDSRDDWTYVQDAAVRNPNCCTFCGGSPPPCCFVAHFGCYIEHDGVAITSPFVAGDSVDPESEVGDVFMRVKCKFVDSCKFVSIQLLAHRDELDPGGGGGGPSSGGPGCAWSDRQFSAVLPGPVTGLGMVHECFAATVAVDTGWEMELGEVLTFPALGIEYTCDDTFDCYGPNNFTLTANPNDVVGLPTKLCVTPKREMAKWCDPAVSVNDPALCPGGTVSDCYSTTAAQCACCDECCTKIPNQTHYVICDACTESAVVCPEVGGGNGLAGLDSPSGPTYGSCATLCGIEQCFNFYCSAGQWKVDVYNNSVFCFTANLSHTCCPLVLGTGSGPLCAGSCGTGCNGINEPCDPPCDPASCDSYPDQLTATFTSSCADLSGKTAILTRTDPTNWAQTGGTLTGWSVSASCGGATFSLTLIDVGDLGVDECQVPALTSTSQECDPVSISFDTQTITDITGCSCVGGTVTATMSA